jgi:hypothetical protein
MAALSSTTLNGAVSGTAPSLILTSATGVSVGTILYVDREAMRVQAIDDTKAKVHRGWMGTPASAHATLATVYFGTQDQFFNRDPVGTAEDGYVTPWINVLTGDQFTVSSGQWVRTSSEVSNVGTGNVTGTMPAANGGTGQASYAVGDLLYASAATTLSKLAGVATGNALISGGVATAPSWGKVALATHVSGTLPVANGGTGATTLVGAGLPVGAYAAYPKTTNGVQTLLAQATGARNVLIFVKVSEAFADGDGGQPTFKIGETDTDDKWAATSVFTSAAVTAHHVFMGTLTSTKALIVTAAAATGSTSTGALQVSVLVMPAA